MSEVYCGKEETTGIRYVRFGSGAKTMAVVPGLSIGHVTDNAAGIVSAFNQFMEDYTVYLFDIRDEVPEDYTIRAMSKDLVQAMQALGLKNIYLYGCSMGGMQSLCIAGTHPELVSKVAVAASMCHETPNCREVLPYWIRLAEEGKNVELCEDMGRKIYSQAFYEANAAVFTAMGKALTEADRIRFIHTASVIPGLDLRKETADISCPVLAIGAEGDQVLGADGVKEIASLTGGKLVLYGKEYPHAVYDEAADLRDQVKTFFDR